MSYIKTYVKILDFVKPGPTTHNFAKHHLFLSVKNMANIDVSISA